MAISILDYIRNLLKECPLLKAEGDEFRLDVDYLEGESAYFSIESVPCEPIIKRYTAGGSMRQFAFVLASRNEYTSKDGVWNRLENIGVYEDFSQWLRELSKNRNLPLVDGEGKTMLYVEATTSGYLMDVSDDMQTARYQIQCRAVYNDFLY